MKPFDCQKEDARRGLVCKKRVLARAVSVLARFELESALQQVLRTAVEEQGKGTSPLLPRPRRKARQPGELREDEHVSLSLMKRRARLQYN
jgi:hypothetical protein